MDYFYITHYIKVFTYPTLVEPANVLVTLLKIHKGQLPPFLSLLITSGRKPLAIYSVGVLQLLYKRPEQFNINRQV